LNSWTWSEVGKEIMYFGDWNAKEEQFKSKIKSKIMIILENPPRMWIGDY
jgi:hypothetical protein